MNNLLHFIAIVVAGAIFGVLVAMAMRCTYAWHHGNSPDPRCVYGWHGYVEVRLLGETPAQDRVICHYRPEVGAP